MKKNVYKAYPHPYLFITIHMLLFLFWLGFLWRWYNHYGGEFEVVDIVLSIILPIVLVISLIYSAVFGWNAVILFDEKKISQRRGLKIFQSYWEEIVDICFMERTLALLTFWAYPYIMRLITADGKKITFTLTTSIQKNFTNFCTNEEINDKFEQMMKLV